MAVRASSNGYEIDYGYGTGNGYQSDAPWRYAADFTNGYEVDLPWHYTAEFDPGNRSVARNTLTTCSFRASVDATRNVAESPVQRSEESSAATQNRPALVLVPPPELASELERSSKPKPRGSGRGSHLQLLANGKADSESSTEARSWRRDGRPALTFALRALEVACDAMERDPAPPDVRDAVRRLEACKQRLKDVQSASAGTAKRQRKSWKTPTDEQSRFDW